MVALDMGLQWLLDHAYSGIFRHTQIYSGKIRNSGTSQAYSDTFATLVFL